MELGARTCFEAAESGKMRQFAQNDDSILRIPAETQYRRQQSVKQFPYGPSRTPAIFVLSLWAESPSRIGHLDGLHGISGQLRYLHKSSLAFPKGG